MSKQILITSEGLNELNKELETLRTTKRSEISEKIRIARGFGDLSENSEYDEAKDEQAMVEARISHLENQLKQVKLIDTANLTDDKVTIGTTVTILDMEFDEEMTYRIVTSIEANHTEVETISDESPVGKALIGHKVGEEVAAHLPNGTNSLYKIINIKL